MRRRVNPAVLRGRAHQRSVRRMLTPSNLPRGRGRHAAADESGCFVRPWVHCIVAQAVPSGEVRPASAGVVE